MNPVSQVLSQRGQNRFINQSAQDAKNMETFGPLVAMADLMYRDANGGEPLSATRQSILLSTLEHQAQLTIAKNPNISRELLVSSVLDKDTAKRLIKSGLIASAPTMAENVAGVDTPVAMLYNLLSVLVPNFAYMEAAAVQPMPTEQAPIFYPNLIANTQRNGQNVGDSLLSPTVWNANNWFTSNRYKNGVATVTAGQKNVTYTVPIFPMLPSENLAGSTTATSKVLAQNLTITVTILGAPNTVLVTSDDGRGNIIPVNGTLNNINSGTVNYQTGVVSYVMNSNIVGTDVHAYDYRFDLDQQAPVQALFEFSTIQVNSYPRRIRSKYGLDNFYAAKKVLQNYNLDEVMSSSLAGYINKEISGGVFENMNAASSATYTWASTLPSGVSWAFHRLSLLLPIVQAKNAIRQNTARHGGNVMICGTSLINYIETLGSDLWTPKKFDREPIGPYVAGTLAGIKIIKNQDYSANNNIMCFKADDTDASYTVGVFIGLYATDPLAMDDLHVIQGLGTKIGEAQVFANSIVTVAFT